MWKNLTANRQFREEQTTPYILWLMKMSVGVPRPMNEVNEQSLPAGRLGGVVEFIPDEVVQI
jgi:hypothetical protein